VVDEDAKESDTAPKIDAQIARPRTCDHVHTNLGMKTQAIHRRTTLADCPV
jgi:hypothetical protein